MSAVLRRVVLAPPALALLPEHASLHDPLYDLRAACRAAVAWLGEAGPVAIVGGPGAAGEQAHRVGAALLADAGVEHERDLPLGHPAVLVMGNGSATRTEKAPGHLDERAADFDAALGAALRARDAVALGAVDAGLAEELWAGTSGFGALAGLLGGGSTPARVDYDDAPYGVQYWVMRWTCES